MLFLVGAGMFFDGFDIYLAAGVLGALVREGLSDVDRNAWFISATFAGMTVGAWLAGILGDRYGRRFTYQFNLAIFGIASMAAAFAPDILWLTGFRFVMGLGLGAEIVVGYGTLSEFMPPAIRGRFAALLAVFTNSALFAATFGGFLIIPYLGWRWMFAIAGIGAGIVWLLRKNMPESPRWLESKGRHAEAEAITRRIEEQVYGSQVAPVPAVHTPIAAPSVPLSALFQGQLLSRTVTGIVINIVNNLITHGFITWMPTFFLAQGMTVTKSLGFTAVMTLGHRSAPSSAACWPRASGAKGESSCSPSWPSRSAWLTRRQITPRWSWGSDSASWPASSSSARSASPPTCPSSFRRRSACGAWVCAAQPGASPTSASHS
nr:MFS transporter [Methylobacterium sp. XJLW]